MDKDDGDSLWFAALNSRFDVCQFLMEKVKDKNPSDDNESTAFHRASKNGHLNVCKLIMEKVTYIMLALLGVCGRFCNPGTPEFEGGLRTRVLLGA